MQTVEGFTNGQSQRAKLAGSAEISWLSKINSLRSVDLQERGGRDERRGRKQTTTHPTAYIERYTQNDITYHNTHTYMKHLD